MRSLHTPSFASGSSCMRFFLTLHMATDWDVVGRLKGQTDIPLSAEGRQAADEFARTLGDFCVAQIVSSDLSRARETAEIIQRRLRVPFTTDMRLRECSFGRLEGLTEPERAAEYGAPITREQLTHYDAYDFRPYGGECRDDVLARHMDVLRERAQISYDPVMLLVGHHCGLNTLLVGLGEAPTLVRGAYRSIAYAAGQ